MSKTAPMLCSKSFWTNNLAQKLWRCSALNLSLMEFSTGRPVGFEFTYTSSFLLRLMTPLTLLACEAAQYFCRKYYGIDSAGEPRITVVCLLSDSGRSADVFEVKIKWKRHALKLFKTAQHVYVPRPAHFKDEEHGFRLYEANR